MSNEANKIPESPESLSTHGRVSESAFSYSTPHEEGLTSKPNTWKPRWKSDPAAQPTPYMGSLGSKAKHGRFVAGPGEYSVHDIAKALNAAGSHSFMTEMKSNREIQSAADDSEFDMAPSSDLPAKIVAIMSHKGANPVSSQIASSGLEIWTRHNFGSILSHIGVPIPLFTPSMSPESMRQWNTCGSRAGCYVYSGMYQIIASQIAKGKSEEVLEFIRQREESKRERSADLWNSKLNSDWMIVRIEKCAKELQKPFVI